MRNATLSSPRGGLITLGKEVRLLIGLKGTGMPPVSAQWFEGAGDGSNWRGSRVLARTMDLPFKISSKDRKRVWDNYSALARIFAPRAGEATLTLNLDGEDWYSNIVRTGGGDFAWGTDSDGSTFIKTVVTVQAGDPYFTRVDGASQIIEPGGLGRGLLGPGRSLSQLKLSTNSSLGSVTFNNPGDVDVPPVWTVNGPFDGFKLTSPSGEVLQWAGTIAAGGWIKIDCEIGTIVDHTGANRYGSIVGLPSFWFIPEGETQGRVELTNAASTSRVVPMWKPKKWVLF